MNPLNPREVRLLLALVALTLVPLLAPAVAQADDYTHYADLRSWLGIPHALDVLSNLPFAVAGVWGLVALSRSAVAGTQRLLAALFFVGLVVTAAASAWFHWQPDHAGLVADRLGMTVAFAGVLGLGVAAQVSARAGNLLAALVLLAGPLTLGLWSTSGNLLPWAVLQGGGLLLLLVFACVRPQPGALPVHWGALVALYAVAKALELADHAVFDATGQFISGHSLKHVVAALAAWPVIHALQGVRQNQP